MPITYLDEVPKSRITYLDEPKVSSGSGGILNKESFGQMLKRTIPKNIKEAAQETYAETISPAASGLSTLAFGIPKAIATTQPGAKEALYPEQKTFSGKALRFGSETAGLLAGGALKAGGKTAGKILSKWITPGLTKKVVSGALTGGVAGALQTPEEGKGILKPEERLKQAETWAALGGVLPIAGATLSKTGEVVTKSGRWVSKNIGGITDSTVKTIKELGANRVFDPLKAKADYISQDLAPRIYNKLNQFVESSNKAYKTAVNNLKGNTINAQPFYQTVQKTLRDRGWIDLRGNPTTDYKSGLDPVSDKLTTLYLRLRAPKEGARLTGKIMSKEDFTTYRDALGSMLREKPSDRLIMQARNALYDSAEKSGMAGIKVARDLEKKVFDIENKIDIEKISKDLIQAKNPQWTKIVQNEYKDMVRQGIIDEKTYKNTFDDLMAHFANQDFGLVSETPGAGGGIYPSRSGLLRSGVAGITKGYYKNIQPKAQVINKASSKLTEAFKKALGI